MQKRNTYLISGAIALSMSATAFAASHTKMVGGAEMFPDKNIVENAASSKDHTTLVAAVKAAGLVETLSGKGPFTVFAPTNAAFEKLPAGTVESLLKPENKDQLVNILTCHVVGAEAMSDAIVGMIKDKNGAHEITTVGGCVFTAKTSGDTVTITDEMGGVASVTIADVKQSNGVIHVIDSVLLPGKKEAMAKDAMAKDDKMMKPSMVGGAEMFPDKNIIENAVNSPIHKTLVAAVKAAGLVDTLQGDGPFTVFAPTDDGFSKLPAGTVDTLLKPENKGQLQKVLTAHVVSGKITAADLLDRIKNHGRHGAYDFWTVSGDALTAQVYKGNVWIYDEAGCAAKVTQADVDQSNGVIHVVNKVLLPK